MQEITLTQNTFKLFPTVYAVQNDTGRELKMIIQDQTLLLGDTGAVAVQRSDGSYYTIAATLNVLDNAFTADISQALTQPGRTLCQLKVTRSSLVVSSYTFAIMVQPSTDGINEAQLGYSVQQLRQDAEDIRTGGMPAALRLALLQIAEKVAYIDDNGAQYYQDLYDALAPSAILTGITAVYTQSGTVYDIDPVSSLKSDLVVTANYSDGTTQTIPANGYTLTGSLAIGTSTVTVTYDTKTTTFSVTVSDSLDKVAYGSLSYRDLFITNNECIIGDFETTLSLSSTAVDLGNGRSYKINAGTPVQTEDASESPTHSLKCYGSSSTQILYQNTEKTFAAQKYLICEAVNVTRRSSGKAGGQFNWPKTTPTAAVVEVDLTATTTGFQLVAKTVTLSAAQSGCRFYIGSYSSANLDCYIDDVVCTPVPSEMTDAEGLQLYQEYLQIRRYQA